MPEEYIIPKTVEEALDVLKTYAGEARVICGGTDLMLDLRNKKKNVRCLVDVSGLHSLLGLTCEQDMISIGGAVTHARAAAYDPIRVYAPSLAAGCGIVGSPQMRNIGSLAGNVVNAQPAADSAIPLIALNADAHIVSSKGVRVVPVHELYAGVGQSKVDATSEIIQKFTFKAINPRCGEGCATERLAQRKMLSLPMANVSVSLKVEQGSLAWIRAAVGPVQRTPLRPLSLEQEFVGQPATEETLLAFAAALGDLASPRNSKLRGSADYRKDMVRVLTGRALLRALRIAQGG